MIVPLHALRAEPDPEDLRPMPSPQPEDPPLPKQRAALETRTVCPFPCRLLFGMLQPRVPRAQSVAIGVSWHAVRFSARLRSYVRLCQPWQ